MTYFTHNDVPDQTGKTFFITGANSGLGFEAAKVLAGKNARVLIGCRNNNKAQAAKSLILETYPNANIETISIDLSDLDSVKKAAAQIIEQEKQLDVLINNAGIMTPPLEYTAQGFESQFGVNHLGPFLLTGLLLEKLKETPNSRVVNTSSIAHRYGKIDFDNLDAKNGYDTKRCYSQSKLANLIYSYELQRRLADSGSSTISIACHPGVADTELLRHLPKWAQATSPLIRLIFNTPLQGAWPTLMAATDQQLSGGEYCGPRKRRQTAGEAITVGSTKRSQDTDLAKKLWDVSEMLTGIHY